MIVRVLGCSGGEAEGHRLTGFLVNGVLALDAGCLTQALSVPEQIAIRHIFLSHSHLDHICTLPFYTKNIFGHTDVPVEIHALPETLDVLRRHLFNDELWPDFSVIPSPDAPIIRYTEAEPFKAYEVGGVRVTPIPVNHLVPTVGFLVEDEGGAFIFTSDTAETEAIYQAANGCKNLKLFITEVSFPNEQAGLAEKSKHLTPLKLQAELGQLKGDIPVGVYHLTPEDHPKIVKQLEAIKRPGLFVLAQDSRFEF